MNPVHIRFKSVVSMVISNDEIDVLYTCAEQHYDALCRGTIKEISTMRKLNVFEPHYQHEIDFRMADIYSKVLEQSHFVYSKDPSKLKIAQKLRVDFGRLCNVMNQLRPKSADLYVDDFGVLHQYDLNAIKTTFTTMLRTADQTADRDERRAFAGYEAAKDYFRSALKGKMVQDQIEAQLNDAFSLYAAMA